MTQLSRSRSRIQRFVTWSLCAWLTGGGPALAQVSNLTPDGTAGTAVAQNGNVYSITGGSQAGTNLFHSFTTFDVAAGDTATFNPFAGIVNIFTRVTGLAPSQINGTLSSPVNLFFMNPAGLMFGQNATLNINGSFYATTADTIGFDNGATFGRTATGLTAIGGTLLQVSNPASFGFLEANHGAITLNTSLRAPLGQTYGLIGQAGTLQAGHYTPFGLVPRGLSSDISVNVVGQDAEVPTLQRVFLSGRHIRIVGDSLDIRETELFSRDADFDPAAVVIQARGSLRLSSSSLQALEKKSDVRISSSDGDVAIVDTELSAGDGNDASRVTVSGRNVSVIRSQLLGTGGVDSGGTMLISGVDRLVITDSTISTSTIAGYGGPLRLIGTDLLVERSQISTVSQFGASGPLGLSATGRVSLNNSVLLTHSDSGLGGSISVSGADLYLDGSSITATHGRGSASGDNLHTGAGSIQLATTRGDITLTNASSLSTRTEQRRPGQAGDGDITLRASSNVNFGDGSSLSTDSLGRPEFVEFPPAAGNIKVSANHGDVRVTDGAAVTLTSSSHFGAAGAISVAGNSVALGKALVRSDNDVSGNAGSIRIEGRAGDVTFASGSVLSTTVADNRTGTDAANINVLAARDISFGGDITVGSDAQNGTAGTIGVTARGHVVAQGGTQTITSSLLAGGAGAAGAVTVEGAAVSLHTAVLASNNRGTGNAGSVAVTARAGDLSLNDGSRITTTAANNTTNTIAADIALSATGDMRLSGTSDVRSDTDAGQAGNIAIRAAGLQLGDVTVASDVDTGTAGTITVAAARLTADAGTRQAFTTAATAGRAGAIQIDADEIALGPVTLRSDVTGDGNAGSISASARSNLSVRDGSVISTTAVNGDAGDIRLGAGSGSVALGRDARVSSSNTGRGNAGTVTLVAARDVDLANGQVTTTALNGDAGDIAVTAGARLALDAGEVSSTVLGGSGRGGNVSLTAAEMRLVNGAEVSAESRGTGTAGSITLTAHDALDIRNSAITTTASGRGRAGSVRLVLGDTSLVGGPDETEDERVRRLARLAGGEKGGTFSLSGATVQSNNAGGGSAGTVSITAGGTLRLADGTVVSTSAIGGAAGAIELRGLDVALDATRLASDNAGSGSAGTISVDATAGDLTVTNGSRISTTARDNTGGVTADISLGAKGTMTLADTEVRSDTGAGSAGAVGVVAANLALGNLTLASDAENGSAGTIQLQATERITAARGTSQRITTSVERGTAGAITVDAADIALGAAELSSNNALSGGAGTIRLAARAGDLRLADGSRLTTTAGDNTAARAADIELTASRDLALAGTIDVRSDAVAGRAGNISLSGTNVSMGTLAVTSDVNSGTAGTIRVEAAQELTAAAAGRQTFTTSAGDGNAGSVTIAADRVLLGTVTAASNNTVRGDAGSVSLTAREGDLRLPVNSAISTTAVNGNAGSIALTGTALDFAGNTTRGVSQVSSENVGTGNAGTITLTATRGAITLGSGNLPSVVGTTARNGVAGTVTVTAPGAVQLESGSRLTSANTGSGNAGAVALSAERLHLSDGSTITTDAANGAGGGITLAVRQVINAIDSAITTNVASGAGGGGDITILLPSAGTDASLMILQRSRLTANAVDGRGGNMRIVTDLFFPSAEAPTRVTASSAAGPALDGQIIITAPDATIVGTLTALPGAFLDAAGLIRELCSVRRTERSGSFVVRGRGGVPPAPDSVLPVAAPPLPPSASAGESVAAPIGRLADGRSVLLTVRCSQ